MSGGGKNVAVLGGGPSGLSAGKVLSDNGVKVTVFEADDWVGGLSRTHECEGFRFDLGGHRFFTKKNQLNQFLQDLLPGELLMVDRSSKIFLRGKYFNYPPTVMNAFFGFGPWMAGKIFASYLWQRMKPEKATPTLEDAIVRDYGRVLFEIFFEPYNEKIWGGPCDRVSAEWLAQRIKGLSLMNSLKNALFKKRGEEVVSLIEHFSYPRKGIGRISERLKECVEEKGNQVLLNTRVEKLYHEGDLVRGVGVRTADGKLEKFDATDVLSSIPITELVRSFEPSAPPQVIEASYHLPFRDLVVVDVRFNRPPITNDTWIYIPEKHIIFGRIHEPTNWSAEMSPPNKTSLVFEYWCNQGDAIWNLPDDTMVELTIQDFAKLKMAPGVEKDAIGGTVVRCPKAYPMYVVGYEKPLQIIKDYLSKYKNLILIGRYGTFMYNNMDHAIETGIRAAENVLGAQHDVTDVYDKNEYMEEIRLK